VERSDVDVLAKSLDGWRPGPVDTTRRVDPWPAEAFANLLDTSMPPSPPPPLRPGDPLPPLWHWFTLLDHPPHSATGPDGHPADGPLLPPIPGRRRMFAGGRLRLDAPILVGAQLTSRSGVAGVSVKSGRSGAMAFVTVRSELAVDGAGVGVEEQDLVYRSEPDGEAPRAPARPDRPDDGAEPTGPWRLELSTDPVLLFRFSALTYNGHRIHYDHPYATKVEGYPGLVVHGPLLALLALELPRVHAPARPVRTLDYRLVRPVFAPSPIVGVGRTEGDTVEASVGAHHRGPSLTATIGLA
jgi:3-methylfumaryl-CoA hydratase